MNCEQVREQLSAYLDTALARAIREEIAIHLEGCTECNERLIELRRFDALIARLPRMTPDEGLREKIFLSAEYRELTGTFGRAKGMGRAGRPRQRPDGQNACRPYLVALPPVPQAPASDGAHLWRHAHSRFMSRSSTRTLISTLLLLILVVVMFFSWHLWEQLPSLAANTDEGATIVTKPLPAGTRFVFQRGGALWSASDDGKSGAARLTPTTVTVAANWAIRPALPGRDAGNMIAYIDLQNARVHLIHSDGQQDKALPQALLKPGTPPSHVWETDTGAAILDSLAWSEDGSMLAFVADPAVTV